MREALNTKGELHPRNAHRSPYDFDALIEVYPSLRGFVAPNKWGNRSINFFDTKAVLALNAALLRLHYGIEQWEIPSTALIPPIPGRADYIHYAADLVDSTKKHVRCLDIGVGATCIYPIIALKEYGWEVVGSDINLHSLSSSQRIIDANAALRDHISLRHQSSKERIFEGIITPDDYFDITICNPPFHDSLQSAQSGTRRKLKGLGQKGVKSDKSPALNFAGSDDELWCEGGERRFIERMISESRAFGAQCGWFSSLVSNQDNLKALFKALDKAGVTQRRVIEMSQGNKRSRILAWKF